MSDSTNLMSYEPSEEVMSSSSLILLASRKKSIDLLSQSMSNTLIVKGPSFPSNFMMAARGRVV